MAPKRRPALATLIRRALTEDLLRAGIAAEVTVEAISGTKLHRVIIIAPKFQKLRQSERQDLAWRIIDGALNKSEQLLIASIWTLTPSEVSESAA